MSTVPSETDDDFSEKCLQMAGLLEGFRRLVPKDLSADVVAEITAPARMAFRRKYCPESLPVTMLNDTLQRSHRFFLAAAIATGLMVALVGLAFHLSHSREHLAKQRGVHDGQAQTPESPKAAAEEQRVSEGPDRQETRHTATVEGTLAPIVVAASEFQRIYGVAVDPSRAMIIGGSRSGPHSRGGSASCEVRLPIDASATKLRISISHGEMEHGKGIHSRRNGGTIKVYLNDKLVHTIVCKYRGMYGDYWPEPEPELGRDLPEIDLGSIGLKGKSLTFKIVTSPWTCIDVRGVAFCFAQRS